MISSGPFALSLGQQARITAGSTVGISFDSVILSNHSPMACQVDIGGPAKWLQPWSSDLYPLPPGDSVTVTPQFTDQTGTTTGTVTADWYSGGEQPPGSYPASLFSEAITAAVTGSVNATVTNALTAAVSGTVTAAAAEFSLTNSPWTINSANVSKSFTFPANSPAITGIAVTYWGSNCAAQLIVTGNTTGNQYLNLITGPGWWVLPITALSEPAGITAQVNIVNGDPTVKTNSMSVVGLTSPQFVRPLYGPGIQGPDTIVSAAIGGSTNATLAGTGNRTNVIRLWALSMTIAGSATSSAAIKFGTTTIKTLEVITNGNNSVSMEFPGGVPLQLFLNPLVLSTAASVNADATVAYSTESP